jgi:hypothetical protein
MLEVAQLVVMVVMEQRLLSQALLLLTLVVAAVYLVAQLVEQEELVGVVMVEVAHTGGNVAGTVKQAVAVVVVAGQIQVLQGKALQAALAS